MCKITTVTLDNYGITPTLTSLFLATFSRATMQHLNLTTCRLNQYFTPYNICAFPCIVILHEPIVLRHAALQLGILETWTGLEVNPDSGKTMGTDRKKILFDHPDWTQRLCVRERFLQRFN